jgi:hypothetical protein
MPEHTVWETARYFLEEGVNHLVLRRSGCDGPRIFFGRFADPQDFEAPPPHNRPQRGGFSLAQPWQTGRLAEALDGENSQELPMINSRWRKWLMGGVAGLVAGCSSNTVPQPPAVQNRAELLSFKGQTACQDLEQYLEDTAVMQMRTELQAQRDQVPGWGWWGGGFFGRGGLEDFATPTAGAADKSQAAPPANYTTTNNQVAGVDEADFVKNDGTRIFVLSGNKLYASKSWPATELAIQGKANVEGWPREMFLSGTDRAVVFSTVWQKYPLQPELGFACDSLRCGFYYSNTTKVTVFDVSDMTNLKPINEYYLPGYYQSARMVGTSVRMVMTDQFRFPAAVKFWPEWEEGLFDPGNKDKLTKKYDDMIATNEQLIRAQVLSDWLPPGSSVINGKATVMPQDCSSFSKVNAPTRLGIVTVATLDVSKPGATLDRNSILGESGEIYASTDNLYVATRHWWWWPSPGQKDTTYVHKFDISKPDQARYVASGTIDGHIVDQFSMDENKQGFFRVATTISTRVLDAKNPNNWWGMLETTNRIAVTQENDGRLLTVGLSDEIAKGESIMSTRFVGDSAYVVTFKQVDPLFTFDLRDPTKPIKVGELKVPGFSSYIHPIDDKHLLTIGTFIPENNTDWRERSLQLSIFDVSDLANPKQTFTQSVGTAYSWSEAQYEHKAFNYFPAKKLLAIPFSDWSYNYKTNDEYWSSFISDLRVFEVDTEKGFTPKGSVSMKDLYQVSQYYNWTYYWTPQVRRSVMADDFVYSISDAGLRVAHISNLSQPIATAYFDKYVEQY